MQLLQGTFGVVAKPPGQPIKQLRMRRQPTHPAEVVGCVTEASTEMIGPRSIHDAPPGQRVVARCQPVSQSRSARCFVVRICQFKPTGDVPDRRQRTRQGHFGRLMNVTSPQDVNDFWCQRSRSLLPVRVATRYAIDQSLSRQTRQLLFRMNSQSVSGNGCALIFRSLIVVHLDRCQNGLWQDLRRCTRRFRYVELRSANQMPAAMQLLKHNDNLTGRLQRDRLAEFKHRVMRCPDLRINSPRGPEVSIQSVRDRPAGLIPIGCRLLNLQPSPFG